ncbi:MAG: ASPIC/UnbV domain-containing protein [Planctomycetes bacterium]|nr:ASPIC/UnbV domain-containing protein [Planctomycetota bacterium]
MKARAGKKPQDSREKNFVAETQRGFVGSWSGYERDRMWLNPSGNVPRFFDAAYVLGLDLDDDGRAALPLDIDGDGDLDLALLSLQGLHLFENTSPRRHFARLRLAATTGQPLALGARVRLKAGSASQQDYVRLADGFLSHVPLDLHFGLGDADRIDELEVSWPSGHRQSWKGLPADRLLLLVEKQDGAEARELAAWPSGSRIRAAAYSADLTLETVRGGAERLGTAGRPLLINFWAPWCEPCKKELPDLARLARRYGSEVRFAGVSLERKDLAGIAGAIRDFEIPYPQFFADEDVLRRFFGAGGKAPLPSTFVFDGTGRLRRAYLRPVTESEVAALLDSFRDEGVFTVDLGLRGYLAHMGGRIDEAAQWLEKAVQAKPGGAWERNEYGAVLARLNRLEEALAQFEAAMRIDPSYGPTMWASHGNLLRRLGRSAEAIRDFEEAARRWPEHAEVQVGFVGALVETGQFDRAVELSARAVEKHPFDAAAFVWRAVALDRVGKREEALAALRKALEIDATNEDAKRLLNEMK